MMASANVMLHTPADALIGQSVRSGSMCHFLRLFGLGS